MVQEQGNGKVPRHLEPFHRLLMELDPQQQETEELRAVKLPRREQKLILKNRAKAIKDGRHFVWNAKTRHGKSEAVLSNVFLPALRAKNTAIVIIDKPGSLVRKALKLIEFYGQTDRALLDIVRYSGRTLGYMFCPPSMDCDPAERQKQNEVTKFLTVRKLLQRRGLKDASKNPIIEEGLELLLDLCLYQSKIKPFHWLQYAFDAEKAEHKLLCQECTRPDIVAKVQAWALFKGQMRSMYCGPALRIIRAFCEKRSVVERDEASFDLAAFLNKNGILLVSGESENNLPEEAFQIIGSTAIYNVLSAVRNGLTTNVLLIIDEGQGSDMIDENISLAAREDAKRGLSLHLLVQDSTTFSSNENVRRDILSNSSLAVGLQDFESAEILSRSIAVPMLDALSIKYEEERIQMIFDGYDKISTTSTSKNKGHDGKTTEGTSTHDQHLGRHREERIVIKHYKTFEEQILEVQQAISNLKSGWFFFKTPEGVTPQPVYIPMAHEPYAANPAFADKRLQEAIDKIISRPEYREPVIVEAQWQDNDPSSPSSGKAKNNGTQRPKNGAPSRRKFSR